MPESTTEEPSTTTKPKTTAYLVCEGATCMCPGGSVKELKLKVTSHKKAYINDNKLVATEKDVNFDTPGNFGTCSFKPTNNNNCKPLVQQWTKVYKDIEVEDHKVLTDQSKLLCSINSAAIITITKHGQTQEVSAEQAENMDRTIAVQVNALADIGFVKIPDKTVKVSSITGRIVEEEKFETVNKTVPIKSEKKNNPKDIFVRPGQAVEFTAAFEGTEALVCWRLKENANSKYFLQHGSVYEARFSTVGKYTIEGYGTGGDTNFDVETQLDSKGVEITRAEYISCSLDIIVKENKLIKISHNTSGNITDNPQNDKTTEVHIRLGVPAIFEAEFALPPTKSEVEHLMLVLKDAGGNELKRTKGELKMVFEAKNSAADYSLEASFDNSDDKPIVCTIKTSLNTVSIVAATGAGDKEYDNVRPGTPIIFNVAKTKFTDDTIALELIESEESLIKWYENSEICVATGPTYSKVYQDEGAYTVRCNVSERKPGWFSMKTNTPDDWHFVVTRNYPTAVEQKSAGLVKIGKVATFEMKSIFMTDVFERNAIHWKLSGPQTDSEEGKTFYSFIPRAKGEYIVSATLNGKTIHKKIECIECEITDAWWTDADGNMLTGSDAESNPSNTIGFAGWGQEVAAAFNHVGLNGEKVRLEVWHKNDKLDHVLVKISYITIPDMGNGVFCSFNTDKQMMEDIKWFYKNVYTDGNLYFKVFSESGLKIANNGVALPFKPEQYLQVDKRVRVRAYFADNNDSTRYIVADTHTPVFAQIKSTNLIGKDLEIEIYKIIGDDECIPIGNRLSFKVDNYGMKSIKLNMQVLRSALPNPRDSMRINIAIYEKGNEDAIYAGIIPCLTLYEKLLTNPIFKGTTKAFVQVDLSEGGKKECECKSYNLSWGNKLTCNERKKVVDVCANLWGESKKLEMANQLLSIIHLESASTFNPSCDNGSGYSGLIQFSDTTAKSIGTTRSDLKKMTFIQQMDYVEKYLKKSADKLKSMTDLYLLVLKPNAVGNGNNPEFIVFDESIEVPQTSFDLNNLLKEPWVTKYGYTSNPTFMTELNESVKRIHSTYSKGEIMRPGFVNGKTYIKEITEVLKLQHWDKGRLNLFSGFCEDDTKNRKYLSLKNRAPWMTIAISKAEQVKGCKEGNEPMYTLAKSYLKYCGNTFEPTDSYNGPWCAAFMNWCIGQTICPSTKKIYDHSKSASSLAPIDAVLGLNYKKIETPIFGCIVVYKHISEWKGHTGFLFGKTEGGEYILLGGNQNDTIRFDSYGEYTSSTKTKKIYGFYIPKDYEPTEEDKLNASDIYKNAEEVNTKYKIVSSASTGKTN
ncbi:PAAR-like protein [uncultured Cytophaga sp.]|uniref:PAAR-like protein n=1 Tax=uncultured Cytophaga sp. TaxID=160238 RepID=UPI002616C8C1|nr:PAAR-like protein [uncultured Cytophaga sp.]